MEVNLAILVIGDNTGFAGLVSQWLCVTDSNYLCTICCQLAARVVALLFLHSGL